LSLEQGLKMVKKTFCTTREAADLLGVSVRTAQLWVENGLLSAWKTVGGHRRVSRDSVEQILYKKSAPANPELPSIKLNILIVEDNQVLLRLYQERLIQWPMAPRVMVASNGVDALLQFGRQVPDLLITDLGMAELDGFQLLRMFHAMPEKFMQMCIVVVSGLSADVIQQRGGIPGKTLFLPKPIPFDTLLEIAQKIWARKFACSQGELQCA
jgi:excisionase family DNA binding protein